MFQPTLIDFAAIIALIGALIFLVGMIKKSFLSHSVSLSKVTEDGESVAFSTNFSVFDSQEKKAAKLKAICDLADDRRAFVAKRFQDLLEAERNKRSEGSQE